MNENEIIKRVRVIAWPKEACRLHTITQRTKGDSTIDACFDADRLDLGRYGIIPDPELMATTKGAEIAMSGAPLRQLERFVEAQKIYGYESALEEMRQGRKRGHWIWFIFPQMKGLGYSTNARFYGITSLEEAKAYLEHPVLGPRLREITSAVLSHKGGDIKEIMGSAIDAIKLKSSMTLFDLASPDDIFAEVLEAFYEGQQDPMTINLL